MTQLTKHELDTTYKSDQHMKQKVQLAIEWLKDYATKLDRSVYTTMWSLVPDPSVSGGKK